MAVWAALAPAKPAKIVTNRLQGYVDRSDLLDATDMDRSLSIRAVAPLMHRLLSSLGRLDAAEGSGKVVGEPIKSG